MSMFNVKDSPEEKKDEPQPEKKASPSKKGKVQHKTKKFSRNVIIGLTLLAFALVTAGVLFVDSYALPTQTTTRETLTTITIQPTVTTTTTFQTYTINTIQPTKIIFTTVTVTVNATK